MTDPEPQDRRPEPPSGAPPPSRSWPQRTLGPTNAELGERSDPPIVIAVGAFALILLFLAVGPRFFAWAVEPFRGRVEERRVLVTEAELRKLSALVEAYSLEHGAPPVVAGLTTLLEPSPATGKPYLDDAVWLRDAWQRPIELTRDDRRPYILTSFGRDGRPGGTGFDADLILPP